jgi:hypothetical protein
MLNASGLGRIKERRLARSTYQIRSSLYIGEQAAPLLFQLSSRRGGYGSYGLFGKRAAYAQ